MESTSETVNTYAWYDGAVQSSIVYDADTGSSSNDVYDTSFTYDALGRLTSSYIDDGKARTVTFLNDELGQAIRRDESNISGQTGAPHEVWYRFGGKQLGYTGNNKTSDISMADSIAERQLPTPTNQGTFRGQQIYGGAYADFAQSYDPLNSYSQGAAGGSYVVRAGDTLAGIAQSLYGDGALWYKIAEANGMAGPAGLTEGQRLVLPTGVLSASHNASTLTPYDPSAVLGDLVPDTNPKPQKKGCGVMGQILLAVIAVAVSIALPGGGTFIGAALNGAIGSAVSQAVGVATGIQEKFSFAGVALAAIGGGVGKLLKGISVFGNAGSVATVASDVARGALSSGITQGIGVATGLQDKFSWAGVAAAGAGFGGALGRGLESSKGFLGMKAADGSFGHTFATATASGIANAATRSAINGDSFGDNLIAAIPDIIGQAVGGAIGKGIAGLGGGARTREEIPILAAQNSQPLSVPQVALNLDPVAAGALTVGQAAEAAAEVASADADVSGGALPSAERLYVDGGPAQNRDQLFDRYGKYFSDRLSREAAGERYDWSSVERAFENDYQNLIKAEMLVATLTMDIPNLGSSARSSNGGLGQSFVTSYDPGFLGLNYINTAGAYRRHDAIVMRNVAYANLGDAGFSKIGMQSAALGTLQLVSGYFGYLASPVNGFGDFLQGGGFVSASDRADTDLALAVTGLMGGRSALSAAARGTSIDNSIEGIYRARYNNGYERGMAATDASLSSGRLVNRTSEPDHLFRANQIDKFARNDLRRFAAYRGDGMDTVRINRRLYMEDGKYTIPDVYFPQSGAIFDGTLGYKTTQTPQIRNFIAANSNAPIGIVRPQSYGGFYWIGN